MSTHNLQHYINGLWVTPHSTQTLAVVNPASEETYAHIAIGNAADVDDAVRAASNAFTQFSQSHRNDRVELLENLIAVYTRRSDEMALAITQEMGAPMTLSKQAQAKAGLRHLTQTLKVLRDYNFDERVNNTLITREPIGVCAFITPWNWPMNQVTCKVGPALAAGCTMILKPSELAPMSSLLFAEFIHEAGVPAGVFNLVNGDGQGVGQALASHPDVDMVSFTGSTRAGILVAKAAAETVKRVHQELGGKSPNIILEDANFEHAVTAGAQHCFNNSGQSCNAPTRMLVPADRHDEAVALATAVAAQTRVGDPMDAATTIGPVISDLQYQRIQAMIQAGIEEGATLAAGGLGKPEGLTQGYYVQPTVFSNVNNHMRIAREEIFGPVLSIIPYQTEEEAIAIANDSVYGLAATVHSNDPARALAVARRLRSGMVHLNGAPADIAGAFGGYKQSGNGREWGRFGLEDMLEMKSVFGTTP
ncbi:aldehyde dehydrogenase family protein [Alcaligenaceae bacterium]|nr:aldehyde dehydrogenase family protein [Alcaligenaceae bacterium]